MKRIFTKFSSLRNVTTTSASGGSTSEIKSLSATNTKNIVASAMGNPSISIGNQISSNIGGTARAPFLLPNIQAQISREINEEKISDEEFVSEQRRGAFYYNSLLNSAVDVILSHENFTKKLATRDWLCAELSVKRIINTNEEMKKIILKMANTVANLVDGHDETRFIHPFIPTAGEVFFGASATNDDTLPEYIQDILTPGLLVLLLNKVIQSHKSAQFLRHPQNDTENGVSKRHVLLAKALVETSAGYLIHRTIQETNHLIEGEKGHNQVTSILHQGNKLATLMGDLLVVSLIKNVASTGCNKVLELTMNSLSEFSTTEVAASLKPFKQISAHTHKSLVPKTLAESSVFSKGFQSSVILSGIGDPSLERWAGELGHFTGLLWKTNFDHRKLNGDYIVNSQELNEYLEEISTNAAQLIRKQENTFDDSNGALDILKGLIRFWGAKRI